MRLKRCYDFVSWRRKRRRNAPLSSLPCLLPHRFSAAYRSQRMELQARTPFSRPPPVASPNRQSNHVSHVQTNRFARPPSAASPNGQLNQVSHVQTKPTGFGQFATKKQADKAWNLGARWLKNAGEALAKNLEKNPQDKALKEQEEYQKYKTKFDQGTVLTGPERERAAESHHTKYGKEDA